MTHAILRAGMQRFWGLSAVLVVALAGCEGGADKQAASPPAPAPALGKAATTTPSMGSGSGRWYTAQQVSAGEIVFTQNCAVCHGKAAQGAFAWRRKGPDGKYPAPPLNGTGHGWHHPLSALRHQIGNALPPGQGAMPPFRDVLSDEQILESIAWFQSQWSDDIYGQWVQINERGGTRRR
jgi:mono/diheme cytochrome c family protein